MKPNKMTRGMLFRMYMNEEDEKGIVVMAINETDVINLETAGTKNEILKNIDFKKTVLLVEILNVFTI
jgi:hypothetical protein